MKKIPDPEYKLVSELQLDKLNPRLPESFRDASQEAILTHMQREYDLIRLGRSIALHGYFPSEALIAVKEKGKLVVVEGNRRLATLLTLGSLPDAANIERHEAWLELAKSKLVPDKVPVVVAATRDQVAPIIGYRHIAGIEPWDPWAKARYIGWMIDEQGHNFEALAEIVSEEAAEVRAIYRNYRLLKGAKEKFKIDTKPAEASFGVFTRTMNSGPIKRFMGIDPNATVKPGCNPVPTAQKKSVEELLGWMFGEKRVVTESRDITRLGTILSNPDGVSTLRKTGDLNEAEIAAGGKKERLLKRLLAAASNLEKAAEDFKSYKKDETVLQLRSRCKTALDVLGA